MAVRALADDQTVGQELLSLGVVKLHRLLLDELALVIEAAEKFAGSLGVDVGGGAGIYVEGYSEFLERILDNLVVTVDDVLGRHAFLARFQGDGHAMLVAAANHADLAVVEAQIAGVDIRRHVDSGEMSDVDGAVGIGESCGDKCSLVVHNLL